MTDFDDIHEAKLRARAERIDADLRAGIVRYEQIGGQRLKKDRTLVSVPITQRYRLVYRVMDNKPALLRCLTHEAYNTFIRRL